MTGLWIALGIVGTLIAFLVVMGRRFAKQLARGAGMWESVATELGLSLQPITGKPGRIRGDLDGFRIEVDIAKPAPCNRSPANKTPKPTLSRSCPCEPDGEPATGRSALACGSCSRGC